MKKVIVEIERTKTITKGEIKDDSLYIRFSKEDGYGSNSFFIDTDLLAGFVKALQDKLTEIKDEDIKTERFIEKENSKFEPHEDDCVCIECVKERKDSYDGSARQAMDEIQEETMRSLRNQ